MPKTVHIIPINGEWTVKREGRKTTGVFHTKREAIENARELARSADAWQVVIYTRDGKIQQQDTHGMPRIQDAPGKKSAKIEKAVNKVTRDRLGADPLPARA